MHQMRIHILWRVLTPQIIVQQKEGGSGGRHGTEEGQTQGGPGREKHDGGDYGGRSKVGNDRGWIQVTHSTATTKTHDGTNGERSQGGLSSPLISV